MHTEPVVISYPFQQTPEATFLASLEKLSRGLGAFERQLMSSQTGGYLFPTVTTSFTVWCCLDSWKFIPP